MFENYSVTQIQELLLQSKSYKDFFSKLGYENVSGGSRYRSLRQYIEVHKLDVSHMTNKRYASSNVAKRDIESYLNNEYPITSYKLKNRLLKENIIQPICTKCKNTEWCGQPIPLQLDHIDGNSNNNNLSNLRLLCPNCHAQTDTYCGKNKPRNKCITCGNNAKAGSKYCTDEKCKPKIEREKKSSYSTEEIYQIFLDNNSNYTATSKIVGISDNAIRKRFKNLQGL